MVVGVSSTANYPESLLSFYGHLSFQVLHLFQDVVINSVISTGLPQGIRVRRNGVGPRVLGGSAPRPINKETRK